MGNRRNCQLLVMRHAKSDWNAPYEADFDRPLNHRGERNAARMGRWLHEAGLLPDRIVSSPARRARQTVEAVTTALGLDTSVILQDDRIYEAPLGALLAVVDQHGGDAARLLLVGHNPGLDALVEYLAGPELPRTGSGKLMTTATIAVLDYGRSAISGQPGSARLERLVRPRDLD